MAIVPLSWWWARRVGGEPTLQPSEEAGARTPPNRSGRSATLDHLTTQPPTPADVPEPVDATPGGPPSRWARNVVIGILVAFVIASNLSTAFLSVLVTERPLLFISLSAQNRNLALASGELDAISFYVVGFLRLIGPDPFFFLLGRWYGDSAIRWMERKAPTYGELVRQLETWFHKARLPVVAIAPNNYVCLFAGASAMAWGPFLAANVVGTIGRLWLVRTFSSIFEGQLGSIRDFIGTYRWPLLALSLAFVALSLLSERRAGRDPVLDLTAMGDNIATNEALRADVAAEAEGARTTAEPDDQNDHDTGAIDTDATDADVSDRGTSDADEAP